MTSPEPKPPPTPLEEADEDELCDRAAAAFMQALGYPRGSTGWSIAWASYDTVAAELDRRAVAWHRARGKRGD